MGLCFRTFNTSDGPERERRAPSNTALEMCAKEYATCAADRSFQLRSIFYLAESMAAIIRFRVLVYRFVCVSVYVSTENPIRKY